LPKIRLNNSSFIERRIYYIIRCMFGDSVVNGYKLNKIEIDIFVPGLNIAIEYDGFYYHKNKVSSDIEKNNKLEKLGISLIRIREIGLNPISPKDIMYDYKKSDLNQLFEELTHIIKSNFKLTNKQLISIDKILKSDINEIIIPSEYFSNITIEESIGFNYPHLTKEFMNSNNEGIDLFKLKKYSKITFEQFWWKCQTCGFEFKETLQKRIRFCGCDKCGSTIENTN
jgi:hypothetical protein